MAVDEGVGVLGDVFFGVGGLGGFRSAVGPEGKDLLSVCHGYHCEGEKEKAGDDVLADVHGQHSMPCDADLVGTVSFGCTWDC